MFQQEARGFLAIPVPRSCSPAGLLSAADDTRTRPFRTSKRCGTWTLTIPQSMAEGRGGSIQGVIVKVAADGTVTVTRDRNVTCKAKWVNMDPQKMKTVDRGVRATKAGTSWPSTVEGDQFTICAARLR